MFVRKRSVRVLSLCMTNRVSLSLLVGAFLASGCPAQSDGTGSPMREPDREALLALPWKQFDQTQDSGWRVYVNPARKRYLEAAKLIEAYLERHDDLTRRQRALCHYHAAHQYIYRAVRTSEGDTREAFPHLDKAIVPGKETAPSVDWNDLVIATKAFLIGDHAALLAVKDRVAAMPPDAVKFLKSPHAPDDLLNNLERIK